MTLKKSPRNYIDVRKSTSSLRTGNRCGGEKCNVREALSRIFKASQSSPFKGAKESDPEKKEKEERSGLSELCLE